MQFELYGSLCVGLGVRTSDIDIALLAPDAQSQPWAHLHAREILQAVKSACVSIAHARGSHVPCLQCHRRHPFLFMLSFTNLCPSNILSASQLQKDSPLSHHTNPDDAHTNNNFAAHAH